MPGNLRMGDSMRLPLAEVDPNTLATTMATVVAIEVLDPNEEVNVEPYEGTTEDENDAQYVAAEDESYELAVNDDTPLPMLDSECDADREESTCHDDRRSTRYYGHQHASQAGSSSSDAAYNTEQHAYRSGFDHGDEPRYNDWRHLPPNAGDGTSHLWTRFLEFKGLLDDKPIYYRTGDIERLKEIYPHGIPSEIDFCVEEHQFGWINVRVMVISENPRELIMDGSSRWSVCMTTQEVCICPGLTTMTRWARDFMKKVSLISFLPNYRTTFRIVVQPEQFGEFPHEINWERTCDWHDPFHPMHAKSLMRDLGLRRSPFERNWNYELWWQHEGYPCFGAGHMRPIDVWIFNTSTCTGATPPGADYWNGSLERQHMF